MCLRCCVWSYGRGTDESGEDEVEQRSGPQSLYTAGARFPANSVELREQRTGVKIAEGHDN